MGSRNTRPARRQPAPGQCAGTFPHRRTCDAGRCAPEHPGVRLTYDQGELEIMSPLLMHDDDAWSLARLVIVLTEELRLPIPLLGEALLLAYRPVMRRLMRRSVLNLAARLR